MNWDLAGIAFVGMLVLDFVWARYTLYVTQKRPVASSVTAAVITALNGSVVLSFVHDPWTLVPAVMGAFVGTYLSVQLDRSRSEHNSR